MAFISMLFATLAVILVVLIVATGIAAVFYVIAAVLAMSARKNAKKTAVAYKRPVSVLILRIIGTIFMLPLIITVGVIAYVTISVGIDNHNNLGYAVQNGDLDMVKLLVENGADIHVIDKCGFNVICVAADNYWDSPENQNIWEKISEYNSTSPFTVQNYVDDLVEE